MRKRNERCVEWLALGSVLLLGMAGSAEAVTISFDTLQRGEIVTNQFAAQGVQISGVHLSGGPNAAIIFDTQSGGPTDLDLQGPNWTGGGNISSEVLSNILIIPEQINDANNDSLVDNPDDEGSRPAGIMRFDFAGEIGAFGLDLVDIEPGQGEMGSLSFYQDDALLGTITFEALAAADASIQYGDNSANRVLPLDLAQFDGFVNRVDVNMGGSGGIDNISFTEAPEPGTLLMMSLGLGMLARASRKR